MTYTELMDQPEEWVDKMIIWKEQKAKVEALKLSSMKPAKK